MNLQAKTPGQEDEMLLDSYTVTDADFATISQAVHAHCGIVLHEGKRELVQARLNKLLRKSGVGSVSEYLEGVLGGHAGDDFIELIDALSTNLTSFFRENDHFVYLATEFMPKFLAERRKSGRQRVRGWSAASSTGEEPYSIAMTLLDTISKGEGGVTGWDVKVLATDISTRVLKQAKAGVYEAKKAEAVPEGFRTKYMLRSPRLSGAYEPKGEVRGMVNFAHLNLMDAWPFTGPIDFIFCRNVMIYFDKPTQQRLIERFFEVMAPGGVLFTGHSESLTGIKHKLKYVRPTIYRKA